MKRYEKELGMCKSGMTVVNGGSHAESVCAQKH